MALSDIILKLSIERSSVSLPIQEFSIVSMSSADRKLRYCPLLNRPGKLNEARRLHYTLVMHYLVSGEVNLRRKR